MSEENQQFVIQKIYLKDASFESPNSPQAFSEGEWTPQINVQINSSNQQIAQDVFEVVLDITVTAKHDEKTVFLAEIKQAGIFTISGFPQENMGGMIGAFCPETLFPYAREVISEMVSKGGFPQLLLAPVNFNALYTQQMQQQAAENTAETADKETAH